MLIQHKNVFGNRIIDRIEVFEGLTSHKSPVMFFNVRTYPNNRKPPPPPKPTPSKKMKRSWTREQNL
ncbi:hypothetical protein NX059_006615 [Plenodomus lindquistii]|nr:hypothetical protein NX059_006615 [Plenodomus lindquistii]